MPENELRPLKIFPREAGGLKERRSRVESSHKSPKSKSKFLWISIFLIVIGLLWVFFSSTSSIFNYGFAPSQPLKSTDGRVNILLLGNGGGTHDGALLTDSIIVASYNINTHQAMLISVPRDLWLESIKDKVNAAYEDGQEIKNGGNGLKFAEDKIDDILGIPIHYGVRMDFNGFSGAIDQIGGIDVNVERAFDDYEYPKQGAENDSCGLLQKEVELDASNAAILSMSPGKRTVWIRNDGNIATTSADFYCRFEHLHFDKGLNHMDGTTALKYVRSRHALGPEGSDFARSRRQQLIIEAFRKKTLSVNTLANPGKIAGLVSTLGKSLETDIPADKFFEFYNLIKGMQGSKSIVLGNLDNGESVLINPSSGDYGGAWVLIPPNNDFTLIKEYIKKQLQEQDASASANTK